MRHAFLTAAAALACIAAFWLVPATAHACAGCRNPNLPQTRTDAGPVMPGSVQLQLVAATTHVRVSHDAGCADLAECDAVPIQPEHTHDLTMVPVQLEPRLAVGVSERVAIEVGIPVRMVSSRASYATPDGTPYTPVDDGVHHRDEVLVGLGDIELAARSTWQAGRWWLTGRLGVRLPTGRTEEDPFALGDAGIRHQHIQFGTGTFDPQLGLDATWSDTRMEWSLYGQGGLSLYENRHGFRGPARGLFGVSGGWKASPVTVLGASLETALEGPERWQGAIRQDASLGRRELLVGPHLSWRRNLLAMYLATRFVVWRDIVEGNEDPGELRAPVTVSLAISWNVR